MKNLFRRKEMLISAIVMVLALVLILLKTDDTNIYMFGLNIITVMFILLKIYKQEHVVNSQLANWSMAFAIFFASLNQIYYLFMGQLNGLNVQEVFGISFILIYISQILGLFYLIYACIKSIFMHNSHFKVKSLKRVWFILFISSFIISIIFLLVLYPGVYTFDSIYQFNQAMGASDLNNHHPIFMTLLLRACLNIGQSLGLSSYGMVVYPFIQIIINCTVFAIAIVYLLKKKVSKIWILPFFLYLYVNPAVYILNVTVWKDVQLATSFLIVIMFNTEYVLHTKEFTKKKSNIIMFVIIMMLFSIWKGNALAVIKISFIIYIISMRGYRCLNIGILAVVILFNSIVTGPIYAQFGGTPGEAREAYSILFQQIGGIMSAPNREVTAEEIETLGMYIDVDAAEHDYRPNISDPIKNTFNEEQFKKDKISFFKVWFDLVKDNFGLAVKATFNQTARYYTIPNNYYMLQYQVSPIPNRVDPAPESNPAWIFKEGDNLKVKNWERLRMVPIVSDIWSIGLYFWASIILLYIYYKKYNKRGMLVLSMPLVLWLTLIASPVNGEYRYAYPFIISILYLLAYSTKKTELNNEKTEI